MIVKIRHVFNLQINNLSLTGLNLFLTRERFVLYYTEVEMEERTMRPNPKRVLIVSASIGSGHNQAAEAIAGRIAWENPGATVKIVDFMDQENSYFNTLLKETYLKMLHLSPSMYDVLYRWTKLSGSGLPVQNLMAVIMKKTMEKLIRKYRPHLVICTHPFPCGAAAYLKKTRGIKTTLAAVITDFAIHRLWVYPEVDLYFVGVPELRTELLAQGIPGRSIHVSGIPIAAAFEQLYDKQSIAAELGLSKDLPTVLVMGGGLGLGGVKHALENLAAGGSVLQLIVLTGRNPKLQQALRQYSPASPHIVRLLGYSHRVPELMACADLLITKPGALTICEALAMKLPLVLYESIPGQEKDNAGYMSRKGAAVWVQSDDQLQPTVSRLLNNPDQLQRMQAIARELRQPQAARNIAAILERYFRTRYFTAANL
ncbi:processive 1,2-diacylglycerol beta-glucosyltransferase [Dendrosporobacter quercicolus]|uniref:Processive 1,2-diacylglycerol beta-glucosyltransferase n=2 Tax=Dendrosporobacter quercicolus TaxID=146817 RepID=A0A1G9UXY4_9FIRM|nr:processive 1,2-diacylglycerol beta-glucosyltransferase [Dendrosporobacter quercicolus]